MKNNGRKRITLVTETRYPQINGVSRIVDQLIKRLLKEDWSIQLLSPKYIPDNNYIDNRIEKNSFSSIRFPLYPEIRLPAVSSGACAGKIRGFAPHVIHILTEGPLGMAALKAAGNLNLPVVTSYHTNFPAYMKHYRMKWFESLCWLYLRRFHGRSAVTLAPTEEIVELLTHKGFSHVRAWGHGVDTQQFQPGRRSLFFYERTGAKPDETVFLYVGRVAPEKNIQILIEAFRLIPDYEKVRLLVVGEGPYRKRIESLKDTRIGLLGFQDSDALSQIYNGSDLFVFPSLTDTFGLVVLEAMASGLPVAAFDVMGPRSSVTDGRNGLLADRTDAGSFSEIMLCLHRDPGLREILSNAARQHALDHGWQRVLDRSIRIYERLAGLLPSGERGTGI
jgi:glycosyltransferase involved in cell wall biosynthesis